jgi:flagellar hook assembly protein FlgD
VCNVGINESTLTETNFTVFPNPFGNSFSVHFYLPTSQQLTIQITDVLGKLVKKVDQETYSEGENTISIDLTASSLNKGLYLMTITTANGMIVKKLNKME